MKKIIICVLLAMLAGSTLFAQQKNYKRLEVGDTIPDLNLSYKLNGKQLSINTRELRGKLLILDFWNIWCSACISAMPEMVKLENRFKEDLRTLLVTNNTQPQIDKQFKAIASRPNDDHTVPGVPEGIGSITADTILHQLFPHRAVPHHIWIGKDGKVKFIARGTDATAENVNALLQEKKIDLVLKKDTGSFNFKAPLYLDGGGRQLKNLKFYSMLYKEAGEWQNSMKAEETDTLTKTYRFRCINFLLLNLIRESTLAGYRQKFYHDNRLVLEVKDSTRFYHPVNYADNSRWRTENQWCYDVAIPLINKPLRDELMMADLNRLLPYHIAIEKRNITCLAIVKRGKKKKFAGNETDPHAIRQKKDRSFEIVNGTFSELIARGLSAIDSDQALPVTDDTGYTGKVTLRLSTMFNLEVIRKDLHGYGLDLIEKKMDTEMLVIRDR
ncbi:TlpA family protein disulfide reductase [Pedobacter psychrodurus]|uniref:TlpA family protein disulfide reductase n=1 Tax=Pedobacter psychrodurus TaxID=2530456 RepID=A0A4R0Q4L2_9SPHI|nr:TlpA disulfide reductase family protein [Pedobacter psychrodurus]TCD28628.1 TlpA family protein disulfide reductase [Pedobacter psychrodurus]